MPTNQPSAYAPLFPLPGDPALPDALTREWLAHYEAGRLTLRRPLAPDILAILEHNDAIFRARVERHAVAARAALSGDAA